MVVWEVVGGAQKGGVLVRLHKDTTSELLEERLSTGALVEELSKETECRGCTTRQLFSENLFTRRSKRSLSTWYGPPVIPDRDVKAYVDLVLSDPKSQVNDPAVPDFIEAGQLEREVYFAVVRFVLQMLHFAVGVLDERSLFGQTLYMLQYQSKEHKSLKRSELNLTPDMIDFALREVEADPKSAQKSLQQYPMNLAPFEKSCEPLIKELLSQRSIPLPENIQEALYKNLLRVLAFSATAALQSSKVDLFGISIDPNFRR
eukprot:symbB.v1.2.003620.t1/scaffold203.1/size271217/12